MLDTRVVLKIRSRKFLAPVSENRSNGRENSSCAFISKSNNVYCCPNDIEPLPIEIHPLIMHPLKYSRLGHQHQEDRHRLSHRAAGNHQQHEITVDRVSHSQEDGPATRCRVSAPESPGFSSDGSETRCDGEQRSAGGTGVVPRRGSVSGCTRR